ncbi:hypothetical protein D9757_005911 [Collybiopsis confluens]|uniref:Amidohydrolase-related domain-containing protein n=1 Tax=Collybiopsis confluens TaxID=2823264 RepID=A0A8H5HNG2_9AGAR|nr:hypothetical protein D9757_005911 [Collybiopsis confluens]
MTLLCNDPNESCQASGISDTQKILAGKLFNPRSLQFLPSQTIIVSKKSGLIISVSGITENDLNPSELASGQTVDLRHLTVLPVFLHSYGKVSWNDQNTIESLAERTIRATVHARKTLMAGFTTVRDLGTEGAADADIALRKCLSGPSPLIPGPKSSVNVNQEGIEGVTGAEVADGVDGCIRAVRRQIGAGADWIKIYANYRFRSRMEDVSPRTARLPSQTTFSTLEMQHMIDTAHAHGVKVAAHATGTETIANLLELGIDSIEHGSSLTPHPDSLLRLLCNSSKTIWVPTLAVHYKLMEFGSGKDALANQAWKVASETFKRALQLGMENVACGGDTGAFSHGENALEMKLMVKLGADWKQVLRWCTLGGWNCIRPMNWETVDVDVANGIPLGDHDQRFGCVEPGWAADLIGVEGNFEKDFDGTVDNVQFVMKSARVYKMEGREVV